MHVEIGNRVINNKNQLRIMENYKNISVNSEIDDVERVERGLYGYLRCVADCGFFYSRFRTWYRRRNTQQYGNNKQKAYNMS